MPQTTARNGKKTLVNTAVDSITIPATVGAKTKLIRIKAKGKKIRANELEMKRLTPWIATHTSRLL
jgi:hypothetical protein